MMFIEADVKDIPSEHSHENLLDRPHSIVWRFLHGTCYLFGGLLFICGSCMYFANVIANNNQALEAGGWLYTIGSACFLLADVQDWLHYRIGLFIVRKNRKEEIAIDNSNYTHKRQTTFFNRYRRVEIDVNYFASIIGSALYLAGSVFFLPKLGYAIIAGDVLFIVGSAAIYLSEAWKIYRLACTNAFHVNDTSFRFQNIKHNLQATFISLFAGLGGVFYFIGTILFLPQFTMTDFGKNRAAGLFLCGGIFFSLAGLLLQYRYYFSHRK